MTTKRRSTDNNPLWATDAIREPEIEKMSSGVPIQCQYCVGQTFRRSRIRANDIPGLLLMRYPVRCARCSQRQTVSFTVAAVSVPSYLKHRRSSDPAPRPDSSAPATKSSTKLGDPAR